MRAATICGRPPSVCQRAARGGRASTLWLPGTRNTRSGPSPIARPSRAAMRWAAASSSAAPLQVTSPVTTRASAAGRALDRILPQPRAHALVEGERRGRDARRADGDRRRPQVQVREVDPGESVSIGAKGPGLFPGGDRRSTAAPTFSAQSPPPLRGIRRDGRSAPAAARRASAPPAAPPPARSPPSPPRAGRPPPPCAGRAPPWPRRAAR